jgi:spore protease
VGTYLTLETGPRQGRDEHYFENIVQAVSQELGGLLKLENAAPALVVGLGNRRVTPDAMGPWAVENTVATRHLVEHMGETFGDFRPVSAVATGVLGSTGVESGELVKALCTQLRPAAVIAVDALAARSAQRLCTTIQLSDTGIVPGSGVGNARFALTEEELGVKVIAIGVPTVVRSAVLCADLGGSEEQQKALVELFVTPKDIDSAASELARIIGYSVTMALQPGLSLGDVQMLLS